MRVVIHGDRLGFPFEGTGALSAGASSRLLLDYPEPERSQILDCLFKPNYGAALQILKVEIGSDTNSTCGSEPCHMRGPDDLNGERGYEWWLMHEAKKRNPEIKLSALQWGAPGWVGEFWSEKNIRCILGFLDLAHAQGLTIDYVGGWNERGFDADWYVAMSKAVKAKYPHVKVVASDDIADPWRVAYALAENPEFRAAVDIVGVHDPCRQRTLYQHCPVPQVARGLGKPLWDSEQSSEGHDVGAGPLARAMNRHYIEGGIVANINWSLISAWYAHLPIADTGLMLAETPWSGHYRVGKSVWVHAHTAQFTRIGWYYLDSACLYLEHGATCVALRSPEGDDYSVVIEAMDATRPEKVTFKLAGGLPAKPVHVWATHIESDDPEDHFVRTHTVTPDENGEFSVEVLPGYLYTLSTLTGQAKGDAKPRAGAAELMPLPYYEDFEGYGEGQLARYFSDINGAFETAPCGGGRSGMCYRQVVTEQPIVWNETGWMDPNTLLGDPRWWGDYRVGVDVLLEQPGYVELLGRVSSQRAKKNAGYHLRVWGTGEWSLYSQCLLEGDVELAKGTVPFGVGAWHRLELEMKGDAITVRIDGEERATVHDDRHTTGSIGLGVSAWQNAQFDNVSVEPTAPWPRFVPHDGMTVSATSEHARNHRGYEFHARNAIDDRPESSWYSEWDPPAPLPQSITLDLGREYRVEGLVYQPELHGGLNGKITRYRIYTSRDGDRFELVAEGQWRASTATKVVRWESRSARHVRLEAVEAGHGCAAAAEINVIETVTETADEAPEAERGH